MVEKHKYLDTWYWCIISRVFSICYYVPCKKDWLLKCDIIKWVHKYIFNVVGWCILIIWCMHFSAFTLITEIMMGKYYYMMTLLSFRSSVYFFLFKCEKKIFSKSLFFSCDSCTWNNSFDEWPCYYIPATLYDLL